MCCALDLMRGVAPPVFLQVVTANIQNLVCSANIARAAGGAASRGGWGWGRGWGAPCRAGRCQLPLGGSAPPSLLPASHACKECTDTGAVRAVVHLQAAGLALRAIARPAACAWPAPLSATTRWGSGPVAFAMG